MKSDMYSDKDKSRNFAYTDLMSAIGSVRDNSLPQYTTEHVQAEVTVVRYVWTVIDKQCSASLGRVILR